MYWKNMGLGLAVAAGLAAAPAHAAVTTLTFDDIWGTPAVDVYYDPASVGQFSSYGGLAWSPSFLIIKSSAVCGCVNGMQNSVTSGDFVAAPTEDARGGLNIVTSATPFQPVSVQLGAAWTDGTSVHFTGKLGGVTVWTGSIVTSFYGPTLFTFPTGPIDRLESFAAGGSYIGPGTGTFSVWDDFRFDPNPAAGGVPEPSTWAMLLAGFGLTGLVTRRRQRAVAA